MRRSILVAHRIFCRRWQRTPCCNGIRQYSSQNVLTIDTSQFPPERIRNFSIIAHIDHGKSTLADRLLEFTGTITKTASNRQVLDKLKVERERGITVKAQSASMIYNHSDGLTYLLNLIDTPGHVDFSYEVSRSLAACQGTLLLVDACQGIQAQTVSNFYLAFSQGLEVIPVVNKIDLPGADIDRVTRQLKSAFELDSHNLVPISAKTGLNIDKLIPRIIQDIPPPEATPSNPLRALLFDSWYDNYVGVVCLLAIKDGSLKKGDYIVSSHTQNKYEVTNLGIMYPEPLSTSSLHAGQVGFVILGMKTVSEAHIGDTFYKDREPVDALPGFVPAKSMVFAGLYPMDSSDFPKLADSISRLLLNDSSVTLSKETSTALGQGFRLGFLGCLHMDVFRERLEDEYGANVLLTAPTVTYRIIYKNGTSREIKNPVEFPEAEEMGKVEEYQEPIVSATLIFPEEYMGNMMELVGEHRGDVREWTFIDDTRVMLKARLPFAEILSTFYDSLKSRSSGYASFEYEEAGYTTTDIVKLNLLINGKPVDALARIVHRSNAERQGKDWVHRLKDVVDKQLFEVVIQASVNNRIIARETISAMRKNVTAKCYGGDVSRRMKLLQAQKEGKKKLKMIGNVQLSQDAFLTLMRGGTENGARVKKPKK